MILKFSELIIHNFLSYGDARILLTKKGYCLVKGINRYPKDRATSNGSGKSSWNSAICWALTGETIQGLTNNLKNINIDENSCYVTLKFFADKDFYEITRIKNPKSDLKIILNGIDISGKGIKESENILAQHLPELTSQLIASIIILGQGLPNKFTANTPAKRKEILEQLSKSDFMIEDIKARINHRQEELNAQLRNIEDSILAATSKQTLLNTQYESEINRYEQFKQPIDYAALISAQKQVIDVESAAVKTFTDKYNEAKEKTAAIGAELNIRLQSRSTDLLQQATIYNEQSLQIRTKIAQLEAESRQLINNIKAAKAISDICPTCGQKLSNVFKPDTSADEAKLTETQDALNNFQDTLKSMQLSYSELTAQIEANYISDTQQLNADYKKYHEIEEAFNKEIAIRNQKVLAAQTQITSLTLQATTFAEQKQSLENRIQKLDADIKILDQDIKNFSTSKIDITDHISVVTKLNTFVKRDFRGILLANIIEYIQSRVQIYASEIFDTNNLVFNIDGNNINIEYCGKSFENLSGGEKQKCDLIIQFAIRDMMEKYLNFSSNILILDEVFDALDACSCAAVIKLISSKATDVESVFVISHRADELELPVDCELTVIKDINGISTIRED